MHLLEAEQMILSTVSTTETEKESKIVSKEEIVAKKHASMRSQVYKDPRPAEYFTRFHIRARTRRPGFIYDLVRTLVSPIAWVVFRARCIAADNVPEKGAVIMAPNHFSFMDHFFIGVFIRRPLRYMAKSQLYRRPLQWIFSHGGTFPVRRGHRDEEAFITSNSILKQWGCIAMY